MTIRAELDNMRERVEAAAKGPWMVDADDTRQIRAGEDEYWLASMRGDTASRRNDAEFIAHARTDLPRLLSAVEAAYAEVEEMRMTAHGALDHAVRRNMTLAAEALETALNNALEGK